MAVGTAVVAGTAGAVRHHQEQKYAQQDYQQQMAQQGEMAQQQAATPPAEDDTTAQIQKLADLHAQGILSDEEFAAAKAKALGI
jgi:membrane protease subunit (stomatin/prohibitin family)